MWFVNATPYSWYTFIMTVEWFEVNVYRTLIYIQDSKGIIYLDNKYILNRYTVSKISYKFIFYILWLCWCNYITATD